MCQAKRINQTLFIAIKKRKLNEALFLESIQNGLFRFADNDGRNFRQVFDLCSMTQNRIDLQGQVDVTHARDKLTIFDSKVKKPFDAIDSDGEDKRQTGHGNLGPIQQ